MIRSERRPHAHAAHPIVFLILILPFGVMAGYLSVAIGYLLAHAGLAVEAIAELVAVSFIPHTWKFLWAPIADTTLKRRTWYVIGAAVSAVGIWATGAVPATAALPSAALPGGSGVEPRGHVPRDVGRGPDGLWHATGPAGPRGRLVPGGQSRRLRTRRGRRAVDGARAFPSRGWPAQCSGSRARSAVSRSPSFPNRRRCRERAAMAGGSSTC